MVNSIDKGKRGEREFAHLVNSIMGLTNEDGVKRTPCSGALSFKGDLIQLRGALSKYHFEVKNQATVHLWTWMEQAEGDCSYNKTPFLAIKKPRTGKFYALIDAAHLIELIRGYKGEHSGVSDVLYRDANDSDVDGKKEIVNDNHND